MTGYPWAAGDELLANDLNAAIANSVALSGGALPLTGGTMSGSLLLAADPTTTLEAATKQYVDAHSGDGGGSGFLPLSGGAMTGSLTLAGDAAAALQPVTLEQLNASIIAAAGVASFNTRTGAVTLTLADVTGAGGAASSSIPVASSTTPGMDGTAAIGGGTTWARADHIHPTDTTRASVASVPLASSTNPAMNGAVAVGTGTTWARADHVHPVDSSRAPTANPTFSGFLSNPGTARFGPGVAIAANTASLIVDNNSGLALAVECSNNAPAAVGLMVRNDRTDGAAITFFFGASSQVGSIAQNGSATAYNTSSDYRLKDVHGPADSTEIAGMIDAVPVYDASFKDFPDHRYPMFLAHELAAACPWVVTGEKNAVVGDDDPMGRQAGEMAPQQVDHSGLVALLWAEVQNVRARLATLEAANA